MSAPDLPPHLRADDGPDPEAEAVVSALASLFGHPRWTITTEREAEWVMSKLAAASREIAETEQLAADYRQRIDEWLADRTRRARATSDWADAHLCRWWQREVEASGGKVLSRKLPSGRVSSMAGRLEWQVVDEQAAITALSHEGMDELVVTKLAGVQALAKALTADEPNGRAITPDGGVVPGLVVVRRPRTYKATPS